MTVIRALPPPPPRSDISPSPIGIIPCTPKTSKPRTKSLSDQFSHCGPGAECLALPGLSWRYAEFQPEACSRGLGRYDVHFYTGADGNSGRKRLAMKSSSVSPGSKLIGSGSVQGTPLPTLHSRGKLTGITSSRPTSAVRRVTHLPASRCLTCPTNFTVGDLSPFPRGASRSRAPGSTNGTTSAAEGPTRSSRAREPDVTHPPTRTPLVSPQVGR